MAVVITTSAIVYLTFQQGVEKNSGERASQLLAQEAAALGQTLEFYGGDVKRSLVRAYLKQDVLNYGVFLALASIKSHQLNFTIEKFASRSPLVKRNHVEKFMDKIPFGNAEVKGRISFYLVESGLNTKTMAIIYKFKNELIMGFVNPSDFSELFATRQSQNHKVYIFANDGQLLVHADNKKIGESFEQHPISKLIATTKHLSGTHLAQWEDKKLALAFDTVPKTNLLVGVEQDISQPDFFSSVQLSYILMSILVALIIAFFIMSVSLTSIEKSFQFLRKALNQLVREEPLSSPETFTKETLDFVPLLEAIEQKIQTSVEKSHHVIEKEDKKPILTESDKFDVFENFSHNLAQVISKPLALLLGYIQSARSETEKDLIMRHLDAAQGELRGVRLTIDSLLTSLRDTAPVLTALPFDDCIGGLVREKVGKFNKKGIKVIKHLETKSYIRTHPSNIEKAISLVIDFFIDNYSDQVQRDIYLIASSTNNEVVLKVLSNSESLNSDLLNLLLEPFHKKISSNVEGSLSVAIANTLIRHTQGVMEVFDAGGAKGRGYAIYLPVASGEEVQAYLDAGTPRESQVDEPSKDDLEEVLSSDVESKVEEAIVESHNATDEELTDSFTGFDVDEDEWLRPPSEEESPVNKNLHTADDDDDSEDDDFKMKKPYEVSEPSIQLTDDTREILEDSRRRASDLDDEFSEDFMLVRAPKAENIPANSTAAESPYESQSVPVLGNKVALTESNQFPEPPIFEKTDLSEFPVHIRKPKVRGKK